MRLALAPVGLIVHGLAWRGECAWRMGLPTSRPLKLSRNRRRYSCLDRITPAWHPCWMFPRRGSCSYISKNAGRHFWAAGKITYRAQSSNQRPMPASG
jgi:hypothetical protein